MATTTTTGFNLGWQTAKCPDCQSNARVIYTESQTSEAGDVERGFLAIHCENPKCQHGKRP
jgi:hypothetical protein